MSAAFDSFADNYEEACQRGLSMTGENRDFFARERVRITAGVFRKHLGSVHSVLDFGCGLGHTGPILLAEFPRAVAFGLDSSGDSIQRAKTRYGSERLLFAATLDGHDQEFDTAYCNGVFHHIPPPERPTQARLVFDALRPGGLFALWENNPWNPGTRIAMSRIPFDRDAITLSILESRQLLAKAGFQIIHTSFHFYFPGMLRFLRPFEPALSWLPLGGQYLVCALKPAVSN